MRKNVNLCKGLILLTVSLLGCTSSHIKFQLFPDKSENSADNVFSSTLKHNIRLDSNISYIINFGESWCVPCMKEIPLLERIKYNYANRNDIRFLYVTESDSLSYDTIDVFNQFTFEKYFNNTLYKEYQNIKFHKNSNKIVEKNYYAIPMTVIIKKNKIVDYELGELDSRYLSRIKKILINN